MEEDIKILEEYLNRLKKFSGEEIIKSDEIIKFIEYKEIQAIENLIKGYRKLEETTHKEHTLGYSQGVYDCSEAWKETIEEIKTENEKRIDKLRSYKHQAPFDFGVLNGIDECCRKLLEDK